MKTVGRGIGLWGDMVVTLRNNDKIELRSPSQVSQVPPCWIVLSNMQPSSRFKRLIFESCSTACWAGDQIGDPCFMICCSVGCWTV